MKSKLRKIGIIALFLVTGSQEQVMKMFGESAASNGVSAQVLPVSKLKQEWCSKTMNYGGCSSYGNGSACSIAKSCS